MSEGPRKAPSAKNNPNHDMCEFLIELSAYERTVSRNLFKSNAYRSAASALAAHPTRVKSGKDASAIKGIGKKIAEKIDEFLATGKLKKLEKIRGDDLSVSLTELSRVSGIGPAKARQLYDAGVTDLTKLAQHTDMLNHHQQIGLKYLEDFEKRIPRGEVESIERALNKSLSRLKERYSATVCGSFRRGSEKSGDVDVLLTYETNDGGEIKLNALNKSESPVKGSSKRKELSDSSSDEETQSSKSSKKTKLEEPVEENSKNSGKSSNLSSSKSSHRVMLQGVVNQLERDSLITDTLSLGDTKFMGVCRLGASSTHRRLDIRLLAPQHYHCGVLYFTGSDLFNKDMRAVALTAGFTLNEYSLRPMGSTGVPGEPLPVSSERDVFDYIGLKYKKPVDRSMI